ncbi:Glutathione S-transferase kappa 1 [Geranomyces variabilis]|nr:Glutathione S-transferase kappa 1 [Geranomyces variabilis]
MPPPTTDVVRFVYDVVSPYSYIAFHLLRRLRSQWNFTLELEPVFLHFILTNPAVQTPPPGLNAQKRRAMLQDINRIKQIHDIPMAFPKNFPQSTLKAQRMLRGIKTHATPTQLETVTANMFNGYFQHGQDMTDKANFLNAILPAVGGDKAEAERLLAFMDDEGVKAELVKAGEDAVKDGAYGTPTLFVTRANDGKKALIFGSDRMDHLAWFLNKEPPVPAYKAQASKL